MVIQNFDPYDYLTQYYGDVAAENAALIRFFVNSFAAIRRGKLLDFGAGPTLLCAIAAAKAVDEIHLCDADTANVAALSAWWRDEKIAFDWSPFIRATLLAEGSVSVKDAQCQERARLVRRKIATIRQCNARNLQNCAAPAYNIVVSGFCLEAAASTHGQWERMVRGLARLLFPGGTLLLTAIRNATSYRSGAAVYPVISINENDVTAALISAGFAQTTIAQEFIAADRLTRDYEGLMLFRAKLGAEARARKP